MVGIEVTIVRLWESSWAEFVPFLSFDREVRWVIYTTNAIESVNARIRKAVVMEPLRPHGARPRPTGSHARRPRPATSVGEP